MNFYPFHLGDYAAHTKHLSLMEDLAYRRMLDLYYTSEAPLPAEPERVARLIGMRDHMQEVSDVLSDFFVKSEAGHVSARCDKEIATYKAKAERAKAANKSRWGGDKSDQHLKSDVKSDTGQIPTNNQEPRTNNQEPSKSKATPVGDPFDGIDPQVVADFKALRTKQRAAITKTAMDGIRREADKAGVSLEDALTICCERGWRGFKADWIAQPSRASPQKTSIYEQGQANAAIAKKMIFGEANERV